MDAGDGDGGDGAVRGAVPSADCGLASRRRPGQRIRGGPAADDGLATCRRRPGQRRRVSVSPVASSSGCPVLSPPNYFENLFRPQVHFQELLDLTEDTLRPYVRQSVLYADRPKKSRGRRGQTKSLSKEFTYDAGPKQGSSKCDVDKPRDDSEDDDEHDSTTVGRPARLEKASTSLSEELRELEEYFSKHTFSSFEDANRYVLSVERAAHPEFPIQFQKNEHEVFEPTPPAPIEVPTSEGSTNAIQNANKWMSEEVMVAFEKYIGERDDLKDYKYELDQLCCQCFNVKNYSYIFHHFNFSVKTKAPDSTVWTSALYFAEVKTIFRQKIYFCYPLEPDENGTKSLISYISVIR
uniref:DUF3615 domain-containing protein n=1 Tax=Leersia perrieri TaxID=77586 RepID=A0A0D9XUS7_9ORYZ